MAITSYSELQSAIRAWTARSDTTIIDNTQVQEFIKLAENRMEVLLPIRAQTDFETLTGTTSSRVLTPTSGFSVAYELFLTTFTDHQRLTPFSHGAVPYDSTNRVPTGWTVIGQTLELDAPCDQAHTFEFLRRVRLYDLATTDPNWLLTNYPGVYLAGSLVEFYRFAQDPEKEGMWEARFQELIEGIKNVEESSIKMGQAFVDPALISWGLFNINSGDYR